MKIDPNDYELVRRGRAYESAQRLAKLAAQADAVGFGHGVSLTTASSNARLARNVEDSVHALKSEFERAGFAVQPTPTRNDPDHHTVLLPKPVTPQIAAQFNGILKRTRA